MKKVRKVRFDDRSRLLLTGAAALTMLLTALLLPLAFRGSAVPASPAATAAESKRRLFADYWLLDPAEQGITVRKEEKPRKETVKACEELMRSLAARCIDDLQFSYAAPDGSEYTVISDGSGVEVRLCRMWLAAQGDWQNWLDVCFDVDSGEIYYLYLSRECLSNQKKYASKAGLNVRGIAEGMAEGYGWTLRWLDEGKDSAAALFTTDSGTACYQLDCRSYDAFIDVKLCCR